MEVVNNTFLPGDPRLIDHIVYELKSQGIFDNFRKECIADVDTKPAYQNLRQRVEGSVSGFLKTQRWRSDMNKNHVREMLRKNISESGFLETGVERIVDQVVNPKINSIFLPQVENVVYKVLGIEKPTSFDDLKKEDKEETSNMDLLPNDLEAVSPESEPQEKKVVVSAESKVDEKIDEDESPPFEPLEESMPLEENSVDSNLSGISGLVSHDSSHSVENKPVPMETSNQDSQFSKQSSDDRLSIVMSDDQEVKVEINEDSNASKVSVGKIADSSFKSIDVPDTSSTEKTNQSIEKSDDQEKHNEVKKSDRHRSSHRRSSHRSRHDSRDHKDRKTDRDKREHKNSRSEDSKERRDKDKDKKDRSRSGRDDKGSKHSKERERTTSNSKHKKKDSKDSLEHKDDKVRSESKDSKSRDRSKEDAKLKSHGSKKVDSKSHSKHNGKTKTDSSDSTKSSTKESGKKNDKHKKDEKRNDKHKDKKESKKDGKKEKDDHYSLKEKKSHRRSTDRDSSDGHSGTHSSSSSYTELTTPSQVQKSSQESSLVSGSSSGGDSGNSDAGLTTENLNISSIPCVLSREEHSHILPHLKLIKPKFASNIFEARRLMKIRRKLGKLEKQKQMEMMRANNSLNSIAASKLNNHAKSADGSEHENSVDGRKKQKADTSKKHVNNSHVKSYKYEEKCIFTVDDDNLVEEVQLSEDMELQTSVISKESWDAIEAKLNAQNILKVDYNSYTATVEEKPKVVKEDNHYKGLFTKDQLEAKRHVDLLYKIIEEQELSLTTICKNHILHKKEELVVEEINKLPKIKIVDVTSNNEVVFSPGRGIKRIANDHDVHNNNKVNKKLGDLLSDRLNDLTENHNPSSNPTPKSKKSKLTDTSVNSLENFNLPLSPAESDKSFNSIGDKKGEVLDVKGRRNRAISNQRYSSDDLYKPRLQFSSKRRRTTKNSEVN